MTNKKIRFYLNCRRIGGFLKLLFCKNSNPTAQRYYYSYKLLYSNKIANAIKA